MFSFKLFWENSESDYRGEHTAPNKEDAPLYDLTANGVYPNDIYSNKALEYYGSYSKHDINAISIINKCKGKPNLKVKIYRSVPLLNPELHKNIKNIKDKISQANKTFPNIDWDEFYELGFKDYSEIPKYINELSKKLEVLESQKKEAKLDINPGDWITTTIGYAKEHGISALKGEYQIISKTVPSKHIFTDGNSILEYGYDPT
jgi:hypothetical protein